MTEEKYGDSYGEIFRQYEDRIVELEKKNAELKKQIWYKEKALAKVKKETQRIVNKVTKDKKRLIKRKNECIEKLEEAKEIIKGFLVLAEMDNREYEDIYKQAEQFLKE